MPLYPHSILKKPKETKPEVKQPESKQPEVKQPENEADVFDRPTAQPGKTNCIFWLGLDYQEMLLQVFKVLQISKSIGISKDSLI
jgi:hypothetical protein